jgi:ribosomal protein S24E
MNPERSVPMNMNGTPSKRMLKNEIEKSCKLNVNQLIIRHAKQPWGMNAAQAMGPRS